MNDKAGIEFMWNHNLISDEAYANFRKACNFPGIESILDCNIAEGIADTEAGQIDPYNIYAPLCSDSSSLSMSGVTVRNHHHICEA